MWHKIFSKHGLSIHHRRLLYPSLILLLTAQLHAQVQPELATALIKMGRVWAGVKANGDKGSFEFRSGFFPNDLDIIAIRGQEGDAWVGAGLRLATTNWRDSKGTLYDVAVFGPTNTYLPNGKVVVPLTNYVRYQYPQQVVDNKSVDLSMFGTYDPSRFTDGTYDQIVEVTYQNVLGVNVQRKIMAWSQSLNDDYIIVDVTFENISDDTLDNFYINMQSNGVNTYRSNGNNPAPATSERFNPALTWQHYYGGRVGDTLRVFYEYSADDYTTSGDNMGGPVPSQNGRLLNAKMCWYSILHASREPYERPEDDQDDFLQPKITYIGTATQIPYNSADDEFGDKNFWAIRGGFAKKYPMSGDTLPGTFHGYNNDELGTNDCQNHPAGARSATNSKMACSFGPYTFFPGKKIHIVYACGFSGLDVQVAQEVGKRWLNGTLEEPPNLPDPEKGYFPANFEFPTGATELDKRKDRWISTGIDSVMKSARRAKWNFDVGYKIPQAPPPPEYLEITGLGTGVEIKWRDPQAEALPNFAGYRIMRRLSAMDTTFYQVIYDSDATDKVSEHLYVDRNVLIGAQYYYYLQAKARIAVDDPLADPTSRGKIIYSPRALIPNIYWINPPHFSQSDLTKIRIVPNPYNINDPLLVSQGWTDQRGIQFFNLPEKVTIKIFTENGDLVQVLHHDSPVKSGYYFWDMITRSQQVISSGVYLAVFQTPNGDLAYQKFLVIR